MVGRTRYESRSSWRDRLRDRYGEKLWEWFAQIASGEAFVPKLPDGREGPIQVPTPRDRLEAARELRDSMYGVPVPEVEIARAEASQGALNAIPDADLKRMVRQLQETDAETVTDIALEGSQNANAAGALPAMAQSKTVTKP